MRTVSPRTRLLAALRGEPVDRQPVHFWNIDPWAASPRLSEPWYRRLALYARRYTEPLAQWWPEQGRGTFYGGVPLHIESTATTHGGRPATRRVIHTPQGDLSEVLVPLPEAGMVVHAKRFLENEADVAAFRSLPYAPPRVDVSSLQRRQAELGERAAVAHFVDDALQVIAGHFEPGEFAVWCATRRAEIVALLGMMAERILNYVRAILEDGGRPVFVMVGPEFATPPLLSPALFREFVLPYDRPLVALMHHYACPVVMHCHGRLAGVLEYIAEVGVDGLHPLEEPPTGDITLAEAVRRVEDRLTIVGNVPVDLLFRGEPRDVRAECRRVLEAASGGRLILSPAAAPYESPFSERSHWNYVELARVGHTQQR